ncbi:hypothetical protein GCM10009799_21750 [Nocardiopsis rhodophaea]|uniref:Uncharacterized protein n=1 Tax=Nocardiopsis rhodophaea TaxID=280238 RepID=A0ABN2SZ28_9ACTN
MGDGVLSAAKAGPLGTVASVTADAVRVAVSLRTTLRISSFFSAEVSDQGCVLSGMASQRERFSFHP